MVFYFKRFFNLLITLSIYSPFALLWMMRSFVYDFAARKVSFKRLPAAGAEIGLKHFESDKLKEFGKLKGNIDGFSVIVKPDEHLESVIIVKLPEKINGLEIALCRPQYKNGKKIIDFETDNAKFNKIFRTKRSKKETADKLRSNDGFIDSVLSFYMTWIFRVDTLLIQNDEILCKLKSGDRIGFFPHIPASRLKALVLGLVEVAGGLNSAVYGEIGNRS
jgi:hypothetical protein